MQQGLFTEGTLKAQLFIQLLLHPATTACPEGKVSRSQTISPRINVVDP